MNDYQTPAKTNRHFHALELDKVLAMLAERTACEDTRYLAEHLEPQTDIDLARALLNQTRDAHMLLARFGGPSFGGLRNVGNALSRAAAGSVLNMRELLDIASVLRIIRALRDWRSENAGVECVLDVYFNVLTPNKFLEEAITSAIISEEDMADTASPELYDIRRKIRVQESRIREQLEKMTRSQRYSKYLQESIITLRNGRYVVPVKSEYRGEVPGLVHDTSSSGATIFIEPMPVVEANNEIKVLKAKERDEIERILGELSATAGAFAETIKQSYECAVELNLIFSKAQLAYSMDASTPELNDEGRIELVAARHPLLSKNSAVPIDVRLGEEFDTLVITGPNTGGKTVAIKTVGLFTLMAMCGLMLPAGAQSKISVFDEVLADIGDEQSIEQSLSTFSSHMVNIIDILKRADARSLVLIDELGAGTDPVEGAALAMAILESLNLRGSRCAATTHYAELKAYALKTPRVENACCEFDVETLRPTYRLLIGVPGRSNAFAISERLGMGADIVDRARELVEGDNMRFEDVIDRLEHTRLELENERGRVTALEDKIREKLAAAEKSRLSAQEKLDREMDAARAEAKKITEQARREAYALLNELEKIKRERDREEITAEQIRKARATIKRGIDSVESAADPVTDITAYDGDYILPRSLEVGDSVIIAGLGKSASVLSLPDKSGNVEIMAGTAKMRVKVKTLRLDEKHKKNKSGDVPVRRNVSGLESRMNIAAETRLDLRGMTSDECLIELDRFIDSSMRTGLSEFTIVHGKGTGALRAAVQKYLKGSPAVKSYRLGVYGEGENGVTIVELK